MTVIDDNLDVSASSVPPTMAERITLILDQFDGAGTRLTAEELVQLTRIPGPPHIGSWTSSPN